MDRGRLPGMRISVVHSTAYRYSGPVYLEPHAIRLRPREDGSQRLIAFALNISPVPVSRSDLLDQDGNVVTQTWFEGLTDELVLRTSFQIETLRENPFDFLLLATDRDLPVQYEEALRGALVPYLGADHDPAVRDFAQQIAIQAGWQTADFLAALNRTVFESSRHITRRDGAPLPPARTLAGHEGSCRDVAVLFCAACRAVATMRCAGLYGKRLSTTTTFRPR